MDDVVAAAGAATPLQLPSLLSAASALVSFADADDWLLLLDDNDDGVAVVVIAVAAAGCCSRSLSTEVFALVVLADNDRNNNGAVLRVFWTPDELPEATTNRSWEVVVAFGRAMSISYGPEG